MKRVVISPKVNGTISSLAKIRGSESKDPIKLGSPAKICDQFEPQ